MSPRKRRIVQAVLYESIAIALVTPALGWMFDEPAGSALALSVLHSVDQRSPLFAYQAQIRYDLIDIGRLPQRSLSSLNTAPCGGMSML